MILLSSGVATEARSNRSNRSSGEVPLNYNCSPSSTYNNTAGRVSTSDCEVPFNHSSSNDLVLV